MILLENRKDRGEPSFSLKNRILRVLWNITYMLLFKYSPVSFKKWRIVILKLFGCNISFNSNVYPRVKIWAPWNLVVHDNACLANDVFVYNQAIITIEKYALISQGAYLCTGSHDYESHDFQLTVKSIHVKENVWIASEAFVGPGVVLAEGCVVGARSVITKDTIEWSVYSGNPAKKIKERKRVKEWI